MPAARLCTNRRRPGNSPRAFCQLRKSRHQAHVKPAHLPLRRLDNLFTILSSDGKYYYKTDARLQNNPSATRQAIVRLPSRHPFTFT